MRNNCNGIELSSDGAGIVIDSRHRENRIASVHTLRSDMQMSGIGPRRRSGGGWSPPAKWPDENHAASWNRESNMAANQTINPNLHFKLTSNQSRRTYKYIYLYIYNTIYIQYFNWTLIKKLNWAGHVQFNSITNVKRRPHSISIDYATLLPGVQDPFNLIWIITNYRTWFIQPVNTELECVCVCVCVCVCATTVLPPLPAPLFH